MQKHYLQDLIEPVVEKEGFELVRVMTIGQANPTLQVMIDTLDGRDITVDGEIFKHLGWIIIGAQTGRRKDVVRQIKSWHTRHIKNGLIYGT